MYVPRTVGMTLGILLFAATASVAGAQAYGESSYGKSANFSQGQDIVIVDNVNVRSSAGGARVGGQSRGATGTLLEGPVVTGGYTWWRIDYTSGVDGWSAEDFMQHTYVALTEPGGQVAGASVSASAAEIIETLQKRVQELMAQLQELIAAQTSDY